MVLTQVNNNYFIGVVNIIRDFTQRAIEGLIQMAVMKETILEEHKVEKIILEVTILKETILKGFILEGIDQDFNLLIMVNIIQVEIIQKGIILVEKDNNQVIGVIDNQVAVVINNLVMLDIIINLQDMMDIQVIKDIQAIKDILVVVDNLQDFTQEK